VGGFNWTKASKHDAMRRYGVEVDFDTERRRQLTAEAAERQAKRSAPKKRSKKTKKANPTRSIERGDRTPSGAARPGTLIVCVACNAEVKNSDFERHRVERHGYTAGVYVRAPTKPQPEKSSPRPVIRRVERVKVVPAPARPKGPGPVPRPVQPDVSTTSPAAKSTTPTSGSPGPGWVRCGQCSTWVKHLARHTERVHARPRRSRSTPAHPKPRTGSSGEPRALAWCWFCKIFVANRDEHRKHRCSGSPLERAEAKAALARAQLEQVKRDLALLSRAGCSKPADAARPTPVLMRTGARAPSPPSDGSKREQEQLSEHHIRLVTPRSVGSSAHCWKCGERLFASGKCSNRNCITLIADE
jgi:hypothetical protein